MASSFSVPGLFEILEDYHTETGTNENEDFPVQTEKYKKIKREHFNYFSDYIKINDYYDIFFICAKHGHVMFTVAEEDDFGTNLSVGKYKDTHLALLWRRVLTEKRTIISDYHLYAPSDGEQAFFCGTPVSKNGKIIGVLVIQISSKKINKILLETNKLYQTAETYIVGKSEDGLYQLKSDRTVKSGKIGDEKKDDITIRCINNQETGKDAKTRSTGNIEYNYYIPLKLRSLQWGLFTTVSVKEVLAPIYYGERIMLLVSIIAILLIIISAYLLSKSISIPIEKVVKSLKKISNKQIDFQIIEKRNDEIGELYRSINEINTNFKDII